MSHEGLRDFLDPCGSGGVRLGITETCLAQVLASKRRNQSSIGSRLSTMDGAAVTDFCLTENYVLFTRNEWTRYRCSFFSIQTTSFGAARQERADCNER